jgi:hypothetical protein
MSAGIVLMNKEGLAVASDSAVTLGSRKAIFNTYQKITQVGNNPVVIYHYDNLIMSNVPAELIFSLFDQEMKSQAFKKPTLKHYVDEFIQFLEEHRTLFNFALTESETIQNFLSHLLKNLYRNYDPKQKEEQTLKIIKTNGSKIKEYYQTNKPSKNQHWIIDWEQAKSDHEDIIKEAYRTFKKDYFGADFKTNGFSEFDQTVMVLLDELAQISIHDVDLYSPLTTGICFAGYGDLEVYPALYHFVYYGFVQGKVLYHLVEQHKISDRQPRNITTLAQDDVIKTIIKGLDESTKLAIKKQLYLKSQAFFQKEMKSSWSENQKEGLKINEEFLNKFDSEVIQDVGFEKEVLYNEEKIMMSIQVLPIMDLAKFAESLINIQILKRTYELDGNRNGTVGGPVRVVTITKTDGVVWRN